MLLDIVMRRFILLSMALGITGGFAAYGLAIIFRKLSIKQRLGSPITWTDFCGDTIEHKPIKYKWAYIFISIMLMVVMAIFSGEPYQMLYVLLQLSLFISVSMMDLDYRVIPNEAVISIVVVRIVWLADSIFQGGFQNILPDLISGSIALILSCAVFYSGAVMTGGQVGMGDVKLAMAIGFILGWKNTLTTIALSGVIMIPFVFTQQGKTMTMKFKALIPFGPSFSAAAIIILVAANTPLARYMMV